MRKIIIASLIVSFLVVSGCGHLIPTKTLESNNIAEPNLKLGIAYLRRGEYEKALDKLYRAKQASPNYPPIYNALGALYQQIGKTKKAEKFYKKALSLDKSNPTTLNNYGQFLCQEMQYDKAEKKFLEAANNPLYRTPEIAFTNAGICAITQNKLDLAESYLREALVKNPYLPIALLKMSELSYGAQHHLSARAYLQRFLEISSHSSKSLWLGIRIERQLQGQDALASYMLLLRNKFPTSKEARFLSDSLQK
ncbi:Type IV pilus biogenesis protein PilF [uncultured Candidatus Thioglobus sp.]|nr:Type IV pilus biogenesis protein PilF [uncultured Candidatus Thioglobus sp.]